MLDGVAHFVGVDVATRLGYAKPRNAITQRCKGAAKWGYLKTPGGVQRFRVVRLALAHTGHRKSNEIASDLNVIWFIMHVLLQHLEANRT
jgi:prophage antirepressor-like protein